MSGFQVNLEFGRFQCQTKIHFKDSSTVQELKQGVMEMDSKTIHDLNDIVLYDNFGRRLEDNHTLQKYGITNADQWVWAFIPSLHLANDSRNSVFQNNSNQVPKTLNKNSFLDSISNMALTNIEIFDHVTNDLNHEFNCFVNDKANIDLNNNDEVKSSIDIANERIFGDLLTNLRNICVGGISGNNHELLMPNGDIKRKDFNADQSARVIVGMATLKSKDSQRSFNAVIFYDGKTFAPFKENPQLNEVKKASFRYINEKEKKDLFVNNAEYKSYQYVNVFDSCVKSLTRVFLSSVAKKIGGNVQNNNTMGRILYNRNEFESTTIVSNELNLAIESKNASENCRAFFTGLLVGGAFEDYWISKCYVEDKYSEYVGQGNYPDNRLAFPKAVAATFDGIAIDNSTRVIIYEKANFQGKILWDKKGPAIINNCIHKSSKPNLCTEVYKDALLQANFPCSVREWSQSNMHNWSYGSLRVLSNKG